MSVQVEWKLTSKIWNFVPFEKLGRKFLPACPSVGGSLQDGSSRAHLNLITCWPLLLPLKGNDYHNLELVKLCSEAPNSNLSGNELNLQAGWAGELEYSNVRSSSA